MPARFVHNEGMVESAVEEQTSRRFQPPYNVQFSVFLDMRVGKLLELLEVFQGQALTLAAMTVIDATDHAVIRVLTSHSVLARRLLQRHNLPHSEADVLVVELPDTQSMSQLSTCLLNAELNIHYVYPLLVRPRGHPAIALHVDDHVLAGQILRRQLFTLLGENDLGGNATGSDPTSIPPDSRDN
jgi:hypothetical protein